MLQHELTPAEGSRKARKRVGRGNASGQGTYAGKGCKGQNARSGGGVRPGFEGGQTPLAKRLPKLKGFKNRFRTEFQEVNVGDLKAFEGKEVTIVELRDAKLVSRVDQPVKLLGNGEAVKVTVTVNKASASAVAKVEKAGGKVVVLDVKTEEKKEAKK